MKKRVSKKELEEILVELLSAFEEVVAHIPEYEYPYHTNVECCNRMIQASRSIQKAQKFLKKARKKG